MSAYLVPEPMTRFRCNEKGCCCKGWRIAWDPDETFALLEGLAPARRSSIMSGARISVDGDIAESIELRRTAPDDACQFLAGDGRCGVQVELGPEILPGLCQRYPAYSMATEDALEIHFDAVCPEVLNRIDESDEPYLVVRREAPTGDHLDARASRPLEPVSIAVGDRELSHDELLGLREAILSHLARPGRSALDKLSDISHALARVGSGHPLSSLVIDETGDIEAFDAYFDTCVAMHDEGALARLFDRYRRFVFDLPVARAPLSELPGCLVHDPAWRGVLDPRRLDIDGLLSRFLGHRFYNAYAVSQEGNQVGFTYGTVGQALAIGFRYALGLSRWLGVPLDRTTLKVGLGASEYLFRTLRLPAIGMPWFGLTPD